MKLRSVFLAALLFLVAGLTSATQGQQAIFAMPEGVVGLPYDQRLPDVLRSRYRRELVSDGGSIEWSALPGLPPGLAIDADGTVYGTPQVARTFTFRVRAVDTARSGNGSTMLTLSVAILKRGQSGEAGGGPVLRPIPRAGSLPAGSETLSGVQVEVSGFEPRKTLTLPLVVKSTFALQLEAIVIDGDGKLLHSALTDKLPAGDVRTSLKIELQVGRNEISIRNAATGVQYKSLTVDVPASTVATVPTEDNKDSGIELKHDGTVPKDATTTKITIHVSDTKIKKINVTVKPLKAGTDYAANYTVAMEEKKPDYELVVGLANGDNKISARDADNEKAKIASIDIKRKNEAAEKFKVEGSKLVDKSALSTPITIKVLDPDIGKIKVMVAGKEKDKTNQKVVYEKVVTCASATKEGCPLEVALPENKDGIAYFIDVTNSENPDNVKLENWEELSKKDAIATMEFIRKGDADVSNLSLNSLNTRAIVGFEQAGGSASDSASKPFLDFFFTAPLWFARKEDSLARLSLWGNIRLAAVPQQVSAFGVLPTNFVNQVADAKLTELIQGFDFNVGPELRLHGTKPFSSLIPGVKQKIDVYLAGGFGAISPLNPKQRDNVQIFTVPLTTSPQYEEFKARFPEAAASGKTFVALAFPERDRFLRQYYAGLRFKTHFLNRDGLLNRFPAIFDLMIGRNEAVTGGKLEHAVLRMEGFYPLPIREADFLYIYGTAMMKLGGGGVKIMKPLFLDTPGSTVGLSSPDLFIVPNRQNNSDYYRIGVGVDLTKLFNRKPKT